MSISDVVNVSISRETVFPTRAGFGVPMLVAYHTATPNIVDFYTSLAGVAADHAVTSPVYKAFAVAFSQNPSPAEVALGKRLLPPTMVVTLTPIITTQNLHYTFDFVDHLGATTHVDYTVGSSSTPTIIAAALATALSGIVGASAVAASGVLTITASTAGQYFDLVNLPPLLQMSVKDTSADPGITSDLNGIAAVDNTTWYGFTLDHGGKAELLAAAAWCESTRHLHYGQSSDSEIANNGVSSDVASSLHAAAYARTGIMYSQIELLNYRAFGLMCRMFTTTPGASTWEYQTIAGDTVDTIDAGSQIKIKAKFCAVYTVLAGLNKTQNVVLSDNEFVDLVPGTDKLFADIQFYVFTGISQASDSGEKIPYNDQGIQSIVSMVWTPINQGIANGFLDADPAPIVSAPKAATIDPATKATRNLPGVTFSATLAGAIHSVKINGTLST